MHLMQSGFLGKGFQIWNFAFRTAINVKILINVFKSFYIYFEVFVWMKTSDIFLFCFADVKMQEYSGFILSESLIYLISLEINFSLDSSVPNIRLSRHFSILKNNLFGPC